MKRQPAGCRRESLPECTGSESRTWGSDDFRRGSGWHSLL